MTLLNPVRTVTSAVRLHHLVLLASPVAFGIWSLHLGQDTNWGLRNYHWYTSYALLHGRVGLDEAPAGSQTFYSPLLDLPWYGLAHWLPAPAVGFIIGAVQSANFVLLLGLGKALIPIDRPVERAIVVLTAITGICGGVVATEIGTTFNDAIGSTGVLGSLLLVVRSWPSLLRLPWRDAVLRALLAGFPVGVAVAGKYSIGPFAVVAILLGPWLLR